MLYGWLVDEQTTIRQILKRLNAGPWLPRSGRHAWSPSTVHHILADPIYVGTAYANRYAYVPAAKPRAQRGPHTGEATCRRLRPREQWIAISVPALVDQEMWDRAQAQLARNAALSFRNNARHSYLLRCLLTCEVCGLAMYGVTRPATATKPERQYYECRGKDCVLSARTAACPSRHVKAEEIEPVVWNYVASLLADPDRLLAQFDHLAATAEAGSARDQAAEQQLRARLDRTVRADKRLLDAYQAGAITLAELSERRQVLASERQALERQQENRPRLRQQRLRAEAVRMDLAAFCNRIHSRLDEATFADKQAILQLVIERIIVGNGRLEIRHVVPLRPPSQPSNNGPVQPIRRLRSDGVDDAALSGHIGPERGERLLQAGRPIDDHELRCLQASGHEIVQDRPPGRLALAAHVFDRQQHLLPILAHAEHDQQRDRGRLAVEPHPHHRAVEDEADDRLGRQVASGPGVPIRLHLPPHPADHVLADRPTKERGKGPPDPARVGAGQVSPGDQRLGSARQALVGRERGVAPFLGPAFRRGKPGPRHPNRHGAERSHQGPLPMAVAMARHRGARRFGAGLCLRGPASRVTLAAKRRLQLGFEQFLDEGADAGAHPSLQRIKPVLAEKKRRLSRLRGRGCDICRHGVISPGAPTLVMAWGTSRRLRRPHIPTTAPTAPLTVSCPYSPENHIDKRT